MRLHKTIRIDCNTILEKQIRKNKITLITKIWRDISDSYLILQEAKKTIKIVILEMEKDSSFDQIKYVINLFQKHQKPKTNEFSNNLNYVTKSKSYQEWKTKLVKNNEILFRESVTEVVKFKNIFEIYKKQNE